MKVEKIFSLPRLLEEIEKLKGLFAHSHPNMSTRDLIAYLTKKELKERDPAQQEVRSRKTSSAPNETARQFSKPVIRAIWKRDEGKCAWVHKESGRRCCSKFRNQVDHIVPWAMGGLSTLENGRLLCWQHNRIEAERWFGREKMQQFKKAQ
jgi:HNH endonuclease